jgi:hypothetical protein
MNPVGTRTSMSWGRSRLGSAWCAQYSPEPLLVERNPSSRVAPQFGHAVAGMELFAGAAREG